MCIIVYVYPSNFNKKKWDKISCLRVGAIVVVVTADVVLMIHWIVCTIIVSDELAPTTHSCFFASQVAVVVAGGGVDVA